MTYSVTAALVIAKDETGHDVYLYRGSLVPANVSQEQVDRFADEGFVSKDGDEPADGTGPADGPVEPAGNASREDWAAFATSKGASDSETADPAEGGLSRNELRDKYAS